MATGEQLELALGPQWIVELEERAPDLRRYSAPPQSREAALELAALLLQRAELPDGDGPWTLARPGGRRTVRLLSSGG